MTKPHQSSGNRPAGRPQAGGLLIPPRPEVLVKVMELSQKPDSDANLIARTISADVGLSAAALKVANSPLYRVGKAIASIQQAVAFLGVKRVVAIVQIVSIKSSMGDMPGLERFWDAAGEVASICALLARRLKLGDGDEAYTLGLFHDCGIPVLMRNMPDYQNVLAKAGAEQRPLAEVEAERYGLTHAAVGGALSRSWHLPEELCRVIEIHHDDFDPMAENANERIADHYTLLKIADYFSDRLRRLWRLEPDHDWERVGSGILAYLGLSEPDFLEVQDEILDLMEKAASGE
jgi:HD-like signal output (HDOD) protein